MELRPEPLGPRFAYRQWRATVLELLDAYSSYLRVQEQALELRAAALRQ